MQFGKVKMKNPERNVPKSHFTKMEIFYRNAFKFVRFTIMRKILRRECPSRKCQIKSKFDKNKVKKNLFGQKKNSPSDQASLFHTQRGF